MIEIAVIGLRWLQFTSAMILFGLALFDLYAPGPRVGTGLALRAGIATTVVAISAAVGLLAQTAVMAGSLTAALDPVAWRVVAGQTALGLSHLARIGLALVAAGLVAVGLRGRGLGWAQAILGLGICASFAWSGHAGATLGVWGAPHLISDVVHVAAAGAWLGALVAFLALVANWDAEAPVALHRSLSRFAGVGTTAVLALTLTGMLNAWVLIGPQAAPIAFNTPYGVVLAVKLMLFAAMLGLATINRFHLSPSLGKALETSDREMVLRRIRSSLTLETLLGLGVLATVAILGTLPPPRVM